MIDYKQVVGQLLSSMQFLGGGSMKETEYDLALVDLNEVNIQNDLNGFDIFQGK